MTDLDKFKEIYQPDRFKEYPGKLEVRASNLDQELNNARKVINDNKLNLEAVTDAQLISYRAFEVREK